MKVIDLLNKIANGEEVPKKILYKYDYKDFHKEYRLKWNIKYKGYYTTNDKTPITHLLADNLWNLNDEVEIIEDKQEPKPITKKDLEAIGYAFGEMKKALQNGWDKSLKNEPFKEDKKIEKLSILTFSDLIDMPKEELVDVIKEQRFKINEIIDEVNKLKDDRK